MYISQDIWDKIRNEQEDIDELKSLLRYGFYRKNGSIIGGICSRPKMSQDMIDHICKTYYQYPMMKFYMSTMRNLSDEMYMKLSKSPQYSVINNLSANPSVPTNVLLRINRLHAWSHYTTVKNNLINNPNFPAELRMQYQLEQ